MAGEYKNLPLWKRGMTLAHTVYAAHGFTPLPEPDRWMVRQAT